MNDYRSWGLTILRVVVGVVFVVHGGQKLFMFGFHNVAGMFEHMGIPLPAVTSAVVILVEFLGGLLLLLGIFTRWAALVIAIDMAGAIVLIHAKNGFYNQAGGFEYPLTLLAASICLALAGPGALALGDMFSGNKA